MQKYELLFVLPGTLDEKEAEARAGEILTMVKEQASDAELHNLGKSRLSYPIKQIRYGYYYTAVFSCDSAGIKAVQNKINLMRDILRTMISYFNTNLTSAQRISYSTDSTGITTMVPQENESAKKKEKAAEKVDLAEIDKKLDEILDGSVITGV
ncbi:MAG: 30S ribosomal protein S6 [Candidatus Magasanikbacteria bacterium]|jgi:ribosomal protein S6